MATGGCIAFNKHSMSSRKVADDGSSDAQMIKMACSRRRARCTHDTCYDHSNLAAYVQSALGDTWQIILPPALGVSLHIFAFNFLSLCPLFRLICPPSFEQKVKPPSEFPECKCASFSLLMCSMFLSILPILTSSTVMQALTSLLKPLVSLVSRLRTAFVGTARLQQWLYAVPSTLDLHAHEVNLKTQTPHLTPFRQKK